MHNPGERHGERQRIIGLNAAGKLVVLSHSRRRGGYRCDKCIAWNALYPVRATLCSKKMPFSAPVLAGRRLRFLMRRAFAHNRRSQARAQIVRQFVELRVAIDFDGFPGRIADHVTVVAPRQMIVEFGPGPGIQRTIEVVS